MLVEQHELPISYLPVQPSPSQRVGQQKQALQVIALQEEAA